MRITPFIQLNAPQLASCPTITESNKKTTKIRGAKKSTGNIVSFEVQPGYGIRIIPISSARV